MYKIVIRGAPRHILQTSAFKSSPRRLLSTAPPAQKSRGWKSKSVRLALAGGVVYYCMTSDVLAEEPDGKLADLLRTHCFDQYVTQQLTNGLAEAIQRLDDSMHVVQESKQPTVDAIVEEKRQRYAQRVAENKKEAAAKAAEAGEGEEQIEDIKKDREEGMDGLEEEASQQGAFNEETGEINWDCPCLGGMAHGPCGDEFKAAFSCFVYSESETKGIECIDKFK